MKSSTDKLLLALNYFVLLNLYSANSLNAFKTEDLSNVSPATREQYSKFIVKSIIPFYLKDALESYPNLTEYLQDKSLYINGLKQDPTSKCFEDLDWLMKEIRLVLDDPTYIFDSKAVWALQSI
jgi:hypothetical protein